MESTAPGATIDAPEPRPARGFAHPRRLLLLATLVVAVLVTGLVIAAVQRSGPAWLSGASGTRVTDGSFAKWRGEELGIAGTWNDNFASQEVEYSLRPGFSFEKWKGNLDDAVGAIYKDRGETWAAAAGGAYDARWRATLTNLAHAWAGRTGTLYIRFAHEFNGEYEPWSVTGADAESFKKAWARFRALQQQIFPSSKLVFCTNSETSASLDLDWRKAFPGSSQVDVVATDYYNQFPYVATNAEFTHSLTTTDPHGAPRGLERHRQFAESVGLPFAIPEWSSDGSSGDGAVFVARFHDWLEKHAGTGPGQLVYEILFNDSGFDGKYQLFPRNRQPQAAAAYRKDW